MDARESADWVERAGRLAVLVAGDVSDESHCQKTIDIAAKEFGRIDVLINNAGFQRTHKDIQDLRRSSEPVRVYLSEVDRSGFRIQPGIARTERREGVFERSRT